MDDTTAEQISAAVTRWVRETYQTDDILIADISPDDEEPERYLVILAIRPLGYWLVAEAWLPDGSVEAINDLVLTMVCKNGGDLHDLIHSERCHRADCSAEQVTLTKAETGPLRGGLHACAPGMSMTGASTAAPLPIPARRGRSCTPLSGRTAGRTAGPIPPT
jgi:hypothetical protein